MAEVKKNNKTKSKKSSKVLDKKTNLNNDELLEQILNKKKNKTQKSIAPRRKNTGASTSTKKKVEKKEQVSSDDIYEQIKQKKANKKKTTKKVENVTTEVKENISEIPVIEEVKKEIVKEDKQKKNEDDLIITREIRFDDLSSDLKNKKTLKELKDAIEEFDKLDDTNDNKDVFNDDIELLPSVRYSNYKLKRLLVIILIVIGAILIILGLSFGLPRVSNAISLSNEARLEEQRLLEEQRKKDEEEARKLNLYNECLSRRVTDVDMTQEIVNATDELNKYLKDNYVASVSYEDLKYGYSYSYRDDQVYYAASTIKSLVALYIYKNASEGKINLDETITYTSKYKVSYSIGVSKHKIGSKIPIRTLVKYAVIYSDNSAHQMLVSYIGRSKLKEFGKNLGAKNTLSGGDNFGNISSNDGLIYMKAINEYIENNGDLGQELKSYFIDSDQKELVVNNLIVANKYGQYKKYYHNIGIMYDESPYVIAIMTLEGNDEKENIINDISNKVYELHKLYKVNRENICMTEIYGN